MTRLSCMAVGPCRITDQPITCGDRRRRSDQSSGSAARRQEPGSFGPQGRKSARRRPGTQGQRAVRFRGLLCGAPTSLRGMAADRRLGTAKAGETAKAARGQNPWANRAQADLGRRSRRQRLKRGEEPFVERGKQPQKLKTSGHQTSAEVRIGLARSQEPRTSFRRSLSASLQESSNSFLNRYLGRAA